jgi:hypothetical protein
MQNDAEKPFTDLGNAMDGLSPTSMQLQFESVGSLDNGPDDLAQCLSLSYALRTTCGPLMQSRRVRPYVY